MHCLCGGPLVWVEDWFEGVCLGRALCCRWCRRVVQTGRDY
jgi:hypothetical protein